MTNHRQDGFGGTASARLAFPVRVLEAVRQVWPRDRILAVALNASDAMPGGTTIDEATLAGTALREAGADVITVLSGQALWRLAPVFGRVLNMLPAGRLRNECSIPTMCAGGILDTDDVRSVLLSGRADYVRLDALGREEAS